MEDKQKLRIDKEFKLLTTPMGQIDYLILEEDIVDNGCREPIVVWEGIIVDGNKRYEICLRWDVPFEIKEINLKSRDDVIHYICKSELRKDDVSEERRKYLVGKLYYSALSITGRKRNPCKLYADISKQGIKHTIANQYSYCRSTVEKYAEYSKLIDKITKVNAKFVHQILSGRIRIAHTTLRFIYELSGVEINFLYDYICENHLRHLEEKDAREIIERNFKTKKRKVRRTEIMIKQMPEYDPDAEVSSLLLTIPSWISSIERTQNIADLQRITLEARIKIDTKLRELEETINNFRDAIEEGY